MDDELLNCVLEICCTSPGSNIALAKFLVKERVCSSHADAVKVAECIYKYFDLAEKGTLAPLKASISRLAKS